MKHVSTFLLACLLLGGSLAAQDFSNPMRINMDAGEARQDGPTIRVDRDGTVYIVWSDFRENSSGDIYMRKSTDGGNTFRPEQAIYTGGSAPAGARRDAEFLISPNGTMHVIWLPSLDGHSTDVRYIRSTDGGVSFSEPASLTGTSGVELPDYPCVAMDSAGTLYAAWIDPRDVTTTYYHQLYFTRSTDDGASWSEPKRISVLPGGAGGSCECCNTAMAASPDGEVYVAFRSNRENVRDIHIARSRDRGATFDTAIRASSEAWKIWACPMAGPDVALDREGTLHIAWKDNRPSSGGNQYTYYTTLRRGAESCAPDYPVSESASRTNYPSLGVTPGGAVFCALESYRGNGSHVDYLYSLDGGNSFSTIRPVGDDGESTQQYAPLAGIGPEGNRYVVWQDNRRGNQDIWFARDGSSLKTIAPAAPDLSRPTDQAVTEAFTAFQWDAPANLERTSHVLYDLTYRREGEEPVTVTGIADRILTQNLEPGSYTWSVTARTIAGTSEQSETWSFSFSESGVSEGSSTSGGWSLGVRETAPGSNEYDVELSGPTAYVRSARISVIDQRGAEVALLHNGQLDRRRSHLHVPAGAIPSGAYFVVVRIDSDQGPLTLTERLILAR